MQKTVIDADVELVIDGFKNFFERSIATVSFDVNELKNFMEPIFDKAGYRQPSIDGARNILLIHDGATGDFISMSPALKAMRREYPAAHITLIVNERAANLAELCPYIDELIVGSIQVKGKTLTSMYSISLELARNLLRRRFDIAIAFTYSWIPNLPLLAYMSGARERISLRGSVWEPLLTFISTPIKTKYHAIDVALRYVEELIGHRVTERELELWVDDADVETARALLPTSRRFYAICLGGAGARKHYPPESYAKLSKMISLADDTITFVLIGGPTDVEEVAQFKALIEPSRVIDLVGKLTFRQTTAVLSFCELYIGNDTAPMHLAAAVGIPILSPNCFPQDVNIYPRVPELWSPRGVPSVIVCPAHALPECKASTSIYGCLSENPHCITQITPQQLFGAYKILLVQIKRGIKQPLILDAKSINHVKACHRRRR